MGGCRPDWTEYLKDHTIAASDLDYTQQGMNRIAIMGRLTTAIAGNR